MLQGESWERPTVRVELSPHILKVLVFLSGQNSSFQKIVTTNLGTFWTFLNKFRIHKDSPSNIQGDIPVLSLVIPPSPFSPDPSNLRENCFSAGFVATFITFKDSGALRTFLHGTYFFLKTVDLATHDLYTFFKIIDLIFKFSNVILCLWGLLQIRTFIDRLALLTEYTKINDSSYGR